MKKTLGILILICITWNADAQLLWKISGNGLKKPSYIFGTHHLAPYSIIDSIKGIRPAFEEAEQIIGEVNLSEMRSPATMQTMQQKMTMNNDTTIESLFTTDEYVMINKYVKENMNVDLHQIPKVKPAFITNNIVVLMYMKNIPNYNPQEQLDSYFQTQAEVKGKEIQALETIEFQLNLLFNTTTVERQAELLACTLSNPEKTIEDACKLTQAYMKQDIQAVYNMALKKEGTPCDLMPGELESIADNRNIAWMEKLPALIKDKASFIVVGALHLPGDKGLVKLFRKAGYTVKPIK